MMLFVKKNYFSQALETFEDVIYILSENLFEDLACTEVCALKVQTSAFTSYHGSCYSEKAVFVFVNVKPGTSNTRAK